MDVVILLHLPPSSLATHFPQPSGDALSARAHTRITNPAILRKRALATHGMHANADSIVLENQFVAGAHTKNLPYFTRNRDLAFAGDFGLLLHIRLYPYFAINSLPTE